MDKLDSHSGGGYVPNRMATPPPETDRKRKVCAARERASAREMGARGGGSLRCYCSRRRLPAAATTALI